MSRKRLEGHMRFASAIALPLCLLVSACGGDGTTMVANIPPPPPTPTPTPTPTPAPRPTGIELQTSWLDSPATRAGNYDILGRLTLTPGNGSSTSYRLVAPGEFTLSSSHASTESSMTFKLNALPGILPAGLTSVLLPSDAFTWTFNPGGPNFRDPEGGDYLQRFGQNLKEYEVYPDGTKTLRENYDFGRQSVSYHLSLSPDSQLNATFTYDVGYSYVAMGEWSWRVVDLNGYETGDSGDLLFVNGERTPSSSIPASGTATYDARTLERPYAALGTPFSLTADFGQRIISTRFDQDYRYISGSDSMDFYPGLGIHVSGSAPFSNNGTFDIPLSGTANYSLNYPTNPVDAPAAQPVTGMMNGAFFGPNAEQVGGVFSITGSGGALQVNEAFVGKQP